MTAVRLDPYQNIVGVSWGGVQLAVNAISAEGSVPPQPPGSGQSFRLYARLYEDANLVWEWGGQIIGRSSFILSDVWRAQDLDGVNLAWAYWGFKIYTGSTSGVGRMIVLNLGKIFARNNRGNRCEYGYRLGDDITVNTITRDQLAQQTMGASRNIFPGSPWINRGAGGRVLGLINTGPAASL